MDKFISFFTDMPKNKNRFGLRVIMVLIAVFCQGIGVYWLSQVNFGTDPCTSMNLGLSQKLGFSYGNTLFVFNCILFLFVILFGIKEIGVGTLANMVIVGYAADFTGWVMKHFLPTDFFADFKTRVLVLIPALIWFIIAAATYMAVDLGQSPYDAVPFIISSKLPKIPFTAVRMVWDISFIIVGYFLGSTIGLVTVLIAFCLGPAITLNKNFLKKVLHFE